MADARERPIIFSAPMVRAILDGRKTMTRRIIKPQPVTFNVGNGRECDVGLIHVDGDAWPRITTDCVITRQEIRWRPGNRAWVRETWRAHSTFNGVPPRDIPQSTIFYAADERYAPSGSPWRPAIHMPRWASRITLLIEEVRVQRLQDISEEDARAEGWPNEPEAPLRDAYPIGWFANLWGDIHGPDAWDRNPWVAALSFRRIEGDPHVR